MKEWKDILKDQSIKNVIIFFNKIVKEIYQNIINEKLSTWFDQNPGIRKIVLLKIVQAALARDVARKAREGVRRKGPLVSI